MTSSSILAQKALAIPRNVRESYLLDIPEIELHLHLSRLLENMEQGSRCEIVHGRDEYGRDIVLRRSSAFGQEYVAVVVKRGDASGKISGRTAGPIDEVISQAKQSIAHLCNLKEIEISTVPIGGVWVAFFGKLTNNAVTRILKEAPAVKFAPFAIGWLADSFAQFYPEVFFGGAASTYLQDKVIELETQHDLSRRPENLSDWYVNPSVAVTQFQASTFSERLRKALRLRRLSYQDFRAQLNQPNHYVLAGSPGFGKTTLLRKLALDLYREALTSTASLGLSRTPRTLRIPLLVSGAAMAKYGDPESFLEEHLPPENVRSKFSVSCLLVDALDEVSQDQQLSTVEFARTVARSLGCALLISARPVHVVRDLTQESALRLPVVQLLPFEYSQAMQLVDRIVQDPEIVDLLKEGISRIQHHMALSPLSVSLLLDIAKAEREVPGTIGEIFEQYLDIALGRYDIERGLEVVFQYFVKRQLLSELAWFEFFKKDRFAIRQREFDAFLEGYFDERHFSRDMIPRMKSDIDRSGIIRFGGDVYFAHRSFLEFFVARYIGDHISDIPDIPRWLAETYFSDKWSDTIFYYFAQRREVLPEFLKEAASLEKDEVDYHWRRFMIGRLLQAGWLSPSAVKVHGIEIGIGSAPKLFEMISKELTKDAPEAIPYGIMAGLSDMSYSSRTLHYEVSETIARLTEGDSADDFRNALNLLWANRTRIPTADVVAQADQVLGIMARLERAGKLSLADKTLGYVLLESIVEDDRKSLRAMGRRFKRLLKSQPDRIRKLMAG